MPEVTALAEALGLTGAVGRLAAALEGAPGLAPIA